MGSGTSTGQLIGAGIGAVIGYYFGGPAGAGLGMSLGGTIGYYIDPPDPPKPPDLGDLGVNTYIRNMPVPIVYGQDKVYGGVIWIGENYVSMENEGNKKNPQYAPMYHADFAVAVSEGTIGGFVSYFINDNSLEEIEEEDKIDLSFSEYLGTDSQAIDSLVSTNLGAAAIPWRYTAYVVCSGDLGSANSLPTLSCIINGLLVEPGETEANTIRVLYDFLTNTRYAIGADTDDLDGDPDTPNCSWKTASDICDVLVDNGNGGTEPRFRYSNVINEKQKGFDIVQSMLATCRGFLFIVDGKVGVKIQMPDEEPVLYLADNHIENYTITQQSIGTRLYADFSGVPTNYWMGDIARKTGLQQDIIIISNTSTYADLADSLAETLEIGNTITISKQNIKSFDYYRKKTRETFNRIRVEFINRDDEFRWDYAEEDDVYDINMTGEIREQTIRLDGVRRKTQAARMASFFLDWQSNIKYFCNIQTDFLGYFFSMGDVVGVTHQIPQWSGKLFRLVGKEELEDYNTKLSFVEYVPGILHDGFTPVHTNINYNIPNPFSKPDHVERFVVIEDTLNYKLYFCFKKPVFTYWAGAVIYVQNGSEWEYYSRVAVVTPSVRLGASIDSDDTTFIYDDSSMYESFPASGSFWIEDEEIYYDSIDDINFQFVDCVRGYNNTTAASHADTEYCYLRQNLSNFYEYTDVEIGREYVFRAVSITTSGILADPDTAPDFTITIGGLANTPSFISLLDLNDQGNDNTLLTATDAELNWYPIVMGINQGYGYAYGDYSGYGDGSLSGTIIKFKVEVYVTSGLTLLRELFLDTDTTTYTYTVAMNESDNGSFETDLTFKVYQVNSNWILSPAVILVTNT